MPILNRPVTTTVVLPINLNHYLFMAKLYFRYAAMNAGKSTSLLQIHHNYLQQGRTVEIYTSGLDDRFGVGVVTSRLGVSHEAKIYSPSTDLLAELNPDADCILLDEAQFLTKEQVLAVHKFVHTSNVPVICFGLRSDFKGVPFEGAAYLLSLSDDIEELKTICACGKKATMNVRFDFQGHRLTEGSQVGIEGQFKYESVCGNCFHSRT